MKIKSPKKYIKDNLFPTTSDKDFELWFETDPEAKRYVDIISLAQKEIYSQSLGMINETKNKVDALKKEISLLELNIKVEDEDDIKEKTEEYALTLEISPNGELCIGYRQFTNEGDTDFCELGYITNNGECHILNDVGFRYNYETWVTHGSKVSDNDAILWLKHRYQLTKNHTLLCRVDCLDGNIYNFTTCVPLSNCGDDNIQKYKNNKTPILYDEYI